MIFNNGNVVDYVQSAANNDTKALYFNLSAPDESNAYQWKKFDSSQVDSHAPYVTVTYSKNSAPDIEHTYPKANFTSVLASRKLTIGPAFCRNAPTRPASKWLPASCRM